MYKKTLHYFTNSNHKFYPCMEVRGEAPWCALAVQIEAETRVVEHTVLVAQNNMMAIEKEFEGMLDDLEYLKDTLRTLSDNDAVKRSANERARWV